MIPVDVKMSGKASTHQAEDALTRRTPQIPKSAALWCSTKPRLPIDFQKATLKVSTFIKEASIPHQKTTTSTRQKKEKTGR